MQHIESHTVGVGGRPGQLGLRDALGPGFAIVAPSEATLAVATGHPSRPRPRPVRH